MSQLPRITLVTPSFQQATFLEECLASVKAQQYPDLEHIVVDGGSTDGSKEILEEHAGSFVWWVSEKDEGQSDALNKGLSHATGDIFGWLNSDDLLLPGTLHLVAQAFMADPGLMVFGGRAIVRDALGDHLEERILDPTDPVRFLRDPGFDQPATFVRMEAMRAMGGIETRLHYTMDLEMILQVAFRHGTASMHFIPRPLAVSRMHGESKTVAQFLHFEHDRASILHGLCMRTGNEDLARMIELGYRIIPGLRPLPVLANDHDLVFEMAVHFLLKWNTTIHRREQFHMMKAFRKQIMLPKDCVEKECKAQLAKLDAQLGVPGWLAFRARRKWSHLMGAS